MAEAAGGHLPVLLFDRVDDIDGRQILRGELVGIEPNAHAVIAGPEKRHVTDSFDARQIVLDAERREVAEVKLVIVIVAVRLLSRYQVHAQEDARRLLFGRHTNAFHFLRQFGLGDRYAVLHQDLGGVQIGSQLEGDVQIHLSVVGALRGHVQHPFDAVDFLLDGCGHGVGHRFGVGTGISGRHLNRGRGDFRILCYRKLGISHHTDDHNDYR